MVGLLLHLLQQQLVQANLDSTTRYARFHPAYTDLAPYLADVDPQIGLASPRDEPDPVAQSAESQDV